MDSPVGPLAQAGAGDFGCHVGKMDGLILEGKDDGKSNKVRSARNGRCNVLMRGLLTDSCMIYARL